MLRRLAANATRAWSQAGAHGALAALAGIAHLAEVHLVDARAGALAREASGLRFDWFEASAPPLAAPLEGVVAAYYLVAFLAFLAWTPGLVAASGNARLLQRTLLCYPLLYALALPWFLFFPSVNPYSRDGAVGPFAAIHPRLEDAYYLLTTPDNTFPSLHVAFTLTLAAALWRAWPAWRPLVATHAALLVLSVVAIRVHYPADVLGGALLAWAAFALAGRLLDSRAGAWLDRASAAWARREASAPRPGSKRV